MLGYVISCFGKINVKDYKVLSFDITHNFNNNDDLNIFIIENCVVLYSEDIITNACLNGHLEVLEWLERSGYFIFNEVSVSIEKILQNKLSIDYNIRILNFLKNQYPYEYKDIRECVNYSFKYGYVEILDWVANSEFKDYIIKNKKNLIDNASTYGHVQILEWFKNSEFEFKYSFQAIDKASKSGNIKILEWFKNSGYEFKYSFHSVNYACLRGRIEVLEWFKNSGYEFKYTENAINWASKYNHIEILEWFKNSSYKFKYNKKIIILSSMKIFMFLTQNIHIKKIIKWNIENFKIIDTIKFKTKNNYVKGYNKN